jgi:hypothetical protein
MEVINEYKRTVFYDMTQCLKYHIKQTCQGEVYFFLPMYSSMGSTSVFYHKSDRAITDLSVVVVGGWGLTFN